jgi:hypothetical protein
MIIHESRFKMIGIAVNFSFPGDHEAGEIYLTVAVKFLKQVR